MNFQALHPSVSYGFYYRVKRMERVNAQNYTHKAHTASERGTANYFVGYILTA